MQWIVERASDEEINHLQELEEQVSLTIGGGGNYWILDMEFHSQILAKATHNEIIHRMLAGVGHSVHGMFALSKELAYMNPFLFLALRSHLEIIKFIRMRDATGASLAMRYHLLQCIQYLKSHDS